MFLNLWWSGITVFAYQKWGIKSCASTLVCILCFTVGCRSDSECPPTQACVNRQCVDPCSYTQCGVNAVCRADTNHRARCYCPDTYRGDPLVLCSRPECTSDVDCPYNLACRNEQCENPCSCGPGALCTVTNHRPSCQCPPGYVGNPHVSCTIGETYQSQKTLHRINYSLSCV